MHAPNDGCEGVRKRVVVSDAGSEKVGGGSDGGSGGVGAEGAFFRLLAGREWERSPMERRAGRRRDWQSESLDRP